MRCRPSPGRVAPQPAATEMQRDETALELRIGASPGPHSASSTLGAATAAVNRVIASSPVTIVHGALTHSADATLAADGAALRCADAPAVVNSPDDFLETPGREGIA